MSEFPEAAMRIGGVPRDEIERQRVAWAAGDDSWREKVAAGARVDAGVPSIDLPDVRDVTVGGDVVQETLAGDGDPLVSVRAARVWALAHPDTIPGLIAREEARDGGPRKSVLAVLRQAARKVGA